jgi:hypothetical protein
MGLVLAVVHACGTVVANWFQVYELKMLLSPASRWD